MVLDVDLDWEDFLMYIKKSSQEDLALKSKFWPNRIEHKIWHLVLATYIYYWSSTQPLFRKYAKKNFRFLHIIALMVPCSGFQASQPLITHWELANEASFKERSDRKDNIFYYVQHSQTSFWEIMNVAQMYHFFKIGRLGSEGTLDFKDPSEEVKVRIL